MSISALLEAADYLERREREAEHGYAIVSVSAQPSQPSQKHKIKKQAKSRRTNYTRSTHNELEKNRRAHLRSCLERLRDDVPAGGDVSRHTTLGLLTRARDYIRTLEERDRMNARYKEQLSREQRLLTERLSQLAASFGWSWRPVARAKSNSCSSSASTCSSASSSSGYATSETVDSEDLEGGTRSPAGDLEGELSCLAMTSGAEPTSRASRRRLIN